MRLRSPLASVPPRAGSPLRTGAPLLALLLLFPSSAGTAARKRQVRVFPRQQIQVLEWSRQYRLVVPRKAASGQPVPLVFAFHGLRNDAEVFAGFSGLDSLARKHGCIVVYPDGINRSWDLRLDPNREVRFVDTLYAELSSRFAIDPERVYLIGFSNGAILANIIASKRSGRFAAVATHSGGLGVLEGAGIHAERKYPVYIIHGRSDPFVPVEDSRRARAGYLAEGHPVRYLEFAGSHEWAIRQNINERIWRFFAARPLHQDQQPDPSPVP